MIKNNQRIFLLFLISHLLIWTLIPSLSNKNLPLDTIEALAWGSNLDWGFNKHPPLSAVSVEIIYRIFGNKDWSYYLLSQIYVCFSFFIIWEFSKDFFRDNTLSLISILLLSGISFYNYSTPEFNVYICELPFWALTVYFFWKSINVKKINHWILLGFFAGLGVLSHYTFLYLVLAIALYSLFLLLNKKINFTCLIAFVPFFIILSPHINWLVDNNYTTLTYAFQRTGISETSISNHITQPIIFIGKQLGILIPFLLMLFTIISKIKFNPNIKDNKLLFLFAINILPIFFMVLTSFILGIKIRTMWMTPFYLFFGVLFLYLYQKKINKKKFKKFISIFLIIFFISPSTYLYISLDQKNKRTDYPGKEIAESVQKKWSQNYKNEIVYVVGDEWKAGNLSYHLKSRPVWLNEFDKNLINRNIGIIYIQNPVILKKVCPGLFGTIQNQGICMIGRK